MVQKQTSKDASLRPTFVARIIRFSEMSIDELFDSFNSLRVLIIGDVMLDSYVWGRVERISPEAPVPVVNVVRRELRLGGAGNVLLNVQALGAEAIICSVIGTDEPGDLNVNCTIAG
jgi:D-glycero-beta-D-manno-heptose-7-phosphate kinase